MDFEYVIVRTTDQDYEVNKAIVNLFYNYNDGNPEWRSFINSENVLLFDTISGEAMDYVIMYAKHHDENGFETDENGEMSAWDKQLVNLEQSMLFEVILAANILKFTPLLDICCKTVADMIKGKSPEEIRKTFNIVNDFTPEEEEQVRRENEWCEE